MCFIYSDVQYFIPFGAILILCASAQFYAPWYDFYFMRFDAIIILCTLVQFYAPWYDFYFMRVSAILCQGNFRHWLASTPIGVVLKRRGRLRACSQRMPRHFNTIAPLGAEACQ